MSKIIEIIVGLQKEIDEEYAEYQRLHKEIYFKEDLDAKLIYKHKTELLKVLYRRAERINAGRD